MIIPFPSKSRRLGRCRLCEVIIEPALLEFLSMFRPVGPSLYRAHPKQAFILESAKSLGEFARKRGGNVPKHDFPLVFASKHVILLYN